MIRSTTWWPATGSRGASVGFVPLEYTPRPGGGLTYTKAELIEFSLCPVPSNAGALAELRAKGLLDPGHVDADCSTGSRRSTRRS